MLIDGSNFCLTISKTFTGGVFLLFSVFGPSYAQEPDTLILEAVEITSSPISKYSIGSRTTVLDSGLIETFGGASLASIISENTPVYIKSQGNGMLGTISFRGTGASHSMVRWQGVNIGYPMLGQSDMSILPVYLSPEIKLQHGSASSQFGSGALGGTVDLEESELHAGSKFSLTQELGSFGSYFSGVSVGVGKENIKIGIKGFLTGSKNNFKFENTSVPGRPIETQENAEYEGTGGALNLSWQNRLFTTNLSTQYTKYDRNLQNTINNNGNPADNQVDESWRTAIKLSRDLTDWTISVSYVQLTDNIAFNGFNTNSLQNVGQVNLENSSLRYITFRVGGQLNDTNIRSPFYENGTGKEFRNSLYGSVLINTKVGEISASARQEFVEGYTVPFTPSLGAQIPLFSNFLSLKAQYAKGYRVPTLNDRFWNPGGNKNLRPELSHSLDLGVSGTLGSDLTAKYEITAYKMWVEDWILWIPKENFWTPENIRSVESSGLEASGSLEHNIGSATLTWTANYSLNRAVNKTGLDSLDRSIGKQLPYTPLHNGNISGKIRIDRFQFTIVSDITGERFVTSDNESSLPAFMLLNSRVSYLIPIRKTELLLYGHLNNILNNSYQNIKNKAMPGFNYRFGLTFNI